jgi:hypothetical protein
MAKNAMETKVSGRLVHGLYARDVLLPWDSQDDFEQLHWDLKLELAPNGRAEEETVLEIALAFWQKRTLWRLRKAAVLEDPQTATIAKTRAKSWVGVRNKLRKAARKEKTELGEVEEELAAMVTHMVHQAQSVQRNSEKASDADRETNARKLDSILEALHDEVFPMINQLRQGSRAHESFRQAYAPESLAKVLQLEAAVDARINKALARLVGLKEFKRTPAGSHGAVSARQLPPA